jgi:uncharacterized membrane protein
MKIAFLTATCLALAALSGCNQGTPGGPGATGDKPSFGQSDDTFHLSVPLMASSLQQGETLEAVIGIKRATNFDEDVTLEFTDVPKGVTVEPATPTIKSSDQEAKLTIVATDEAPLGEFKVKVTGRPTQGSDAHIEFKLNITAKDSFTLSSPRSTTLRQGQSQTVSIGIKRDKTFDQDVALKFGDLPNGVTAEPSAPVIEEGESTAQVTLTATEDASLGNFVIDVTGHPAEGADASTKLQLTVAVSAAP